MSKVEGEIESQSIEIGVAEKRLVQLEMEALRRVLDKHQPDDRHLPEGMPVSTAVSIEERRRERQMPLHMPYRPSAFFD